LTIQKQFEEKCAALQAVDLAEIKNMAVKLFSPSIQGLSVDLNTIFHEVVQNGISYSNLNFCRI